MSGRPSAPPLHPMEFGYNELVFYGGGPGSLNGSPDPRIPGGYAVPTIPHPPPTVPVAPGQFVTAIAPFPTTRGFQMAPFVHGPFAHPQVPQPTAAAFAVTAPSPAPPQGGFGFVTQAVPNTLPTMAPPSPVGFGIDGGDSQFGRSQSPATGDRGDFEFPSGFGGGVVTFGAGNTDGENFLQRTRHRYAQLHRRLNELFREYAYWERDQPMGDEMWNLTRWWQNNEWHRVFAQVQILAELLSEEEPIGITERVSALPSRFWTGQMELHAEDDDRDGNGDGLHFR